MKQLHKPTGMVFNSRKEAKDYLGTNRYKNAVRFNELVFINDIAFYENELPKNK